MNLDVHAMDLFPLIHIGFLQKVLSRKGSNRMEKPNADDLEADDASKKIVVKGQKFAYFLIRRR